MNRQRLSILIVDNNAASGIALRRIVSELGHEPMIATTAAGAVALASLRRYDVLLCSLPLADGSGYALLRQIAAMYPIKAIALTVAEEGTDVRAACRDAGFSDVVQKSMPVDTLRPMVDRLSYGQSNPATAPDPSAFFSI